jgi:hypothetical protein
MPYVTGSSDDELTSVTAISSTDVWAVGSISAQKTLIENWNGTSWSIVSSPNSTDPTNILNSISGDSANDIWAAGNHGNSSQYTGEGLVEHWNGSDWTIVTTPTSGQYLGAFTGVAAVSTSSATAVGFYDDSNGVKAPLVEQWNGSSWSVVTIPTPFSDYSLLNAVSALSSTTFFSVGVNLPNSYYQTIIEYGSNLHITLHCPSGSS